MLPLIPMCRRLTLLQNDVNLVVDNATLYNKPGTPFHKTALRIRASAAPIIEEIAVAGKKEAIMGHPTIGDLEPPLELVDLLMSKESVDGPDVDIVLDDIPLALLFKYELPKDKPPPPPPPPKPPKAPKVKRDRKAEWHKRRMQQLEKEKAEGEGDVVHVEGEIEVERDAMDMATATHRTPRTRRGATNATQNTSATAILSSSPSPPESPEMEPEFIEPEVPVIPEAPTVEPEPSTSGITSTTAVMNAPKRPQTRKRHSMVPGGQEAPPQVDAVDNQGSFKFFDVGWILPPDQKRRARTSVVPPPPSVSRPRKRARTGQWCHHIFPSCSGVHFLFRCWAIEVVRCQYGCV